LNGYRTFQRSFIETFSFSTNPEEANEVIMDRAPACDVLALTLQVGTIQVCPPAGFAGDMQINALSLTDGTNCNCSN
jgi:hypothetical protein